MRKNFDVGMVLAEVATRLRAGSSQENAWKQTFIRQGFNDDGQVDEEGVPDVLRDLCQKKYRRKEHANIVWALPQAIAVCRMSKISGIPTAEVLESCAEGITEAAEAAAARKVALAGPKSTARLLAFMPIMGILLGEMMGVEPLVFLTASPAGIGLLVVAGVLEVLGIMWVKVLVRKAERDE